jgi:hypothetical protein
MRLHERSPDGYSVKVLANDAICITGPHSATFYRRAAWTSHFLSHLRQGYFDPAPARR